MEADKNNTTGTSEHQTHGTQNTDFAGTNNSSTGGYSRGEQGDVEKLMVDQGYDGGADVNPVIEINHKLNLMKLAKDQFDEDEKTEDLVLNRFNGQPVVVYNMGPEDEYVQVMTAEYSKYCHPYINLVYGYKHSDTEDLLIIREHVHGKNYYSVNYYDHLEDRLVAFYKCLTLIEYIHSFKAFLRIIRPEKFILGGGLTCVKLVDVIKHDNRYLTRIQANNKVEPSMRFISPELYEEIEADDGLERSMEFEKVQRADLYSVGCFLYYAITKRMPWDGYNKKDDIMKAHRMNKTAFLKEDDIVDDEGKRDPELYKWLQNCFSNKWGDDLTDFREKMEKRPVIAGFIGENGGDLLMDYEKGN